MQLELYQVDAFTNERFGGNPAAVVPLKEWLPDGLLGKIAMENNLSETAFVVPDQTGFALRWFTPAEEVKLCGHATLAAAHVLYSHLHYRHPSIRFTTLSGQLVVHKHPDGYAIDFPATIPQKVQGSELITRALGTEICSVSTGLDYIVEVPSESALRALSPNFAELSRLDLRGVVVTAIAEDPCFDFVSRCFYPKLDVNEDPVTGSAHCQLAPYWQIKLNKAALLGCQLSQRGGIVNCEVADNRVILVGNAVDYLKGTIML